MNDQTEDSTPNESTMDIERDPDCRVYVADLSLSFNVGDAFEVSLLRQSHRPIARVRTNKDGKSSEKFKINLGLSEVARLRLSGESAPQLAFDLLAVIVRSGDIDIDALKENFDKLLSIASDEDSDDE